MLHNHRLFIGFRDFIKNHYVQVKKDNPKVPILIRECNGTQPKLFARYGEYWHPTVLYLIFNRLKCIFGFTLAEMGRESSVALTNVAAKEVLKQIESLSK